MRHYPRTQCHEDNRCRGLCECYTNVIPKAGLEGSCRVFSQSPSTSSLRPTPWEASGECVAPGKASSLTRLSFPQMSGYLGLKFFFPFGQFDEFPNFSFKKCHLPSVRQEQHLSLMPLELGHDVFHGVLIAWCDHGSF